MVQLFASGGIHLHNGILQCKGHPVLIALLSGLALRR